MIGNIKLLKISGWSDGDFLFIENISENGDRNRSYSSINLDVYNVTLVRRVYQSELEPFYKSSRELNRYHP